MSADTIWKVLEYIVKANKTIDQLRELCAATYQVVGAADGPVEMLDNLSAAGNGEPLPHEPGAGLPWVPEDALADSQALQRIRKFIEEYKKMRGLHPEVVYGLHAGFKGREVEIRISDLEALATPRHDGRSATVLTTERLPTEVLTALIKAEAALADIGDAEREPGDDLTWCEQRAAEALPLLRETIAHYNPQS